MIFGLIRLISETRNLLFVISGIALSMFFVIGLSTHKLNNLENSIISYNDFRVLRLSPNDDKQVSDLRYLQLTSNELDFWTDANSVNSSIDVMVPPNILESFENFLQRRNISYEIFMDNVQTVIDSNAAEQKSYKIPIDDSVDYTTISWKRYHRLKEIYRFLNRLAIAHPNFVEIIEIGKSFEGRSIRLIKIGKPLRGVDKPAIWIDGGTHAREWIATATALYVADQLVNNCSYYQKLLEGIVWYILPVANPDGYEYSHTHLRLWKKSRHGSRDGKCIGTDLNRNFGFYWNHVGTSNNPCSEVFPGVKAFSEPETQAIADFVLSQKNFKLFISLHSYQQVIRFACWPFTKKKKPKQVINLGTEVAEAITSVYGNHYQFGCSDDLLYKSSGGSTEWANGFAGIKYTYSIELRDKGKFGFLLPASEIAETGSEFMEAIKIFGKNVLNM